MRLGAGIWAVTLAGARRRNAPICNRSFTNPSHAHVNPTGGCVGPFMRTLTRQVVAWGSSPTARPSSAWSEPSSPNKTTNGPKADATSASTSSPDHDSHPNPPNRRTPHSNSAHNPTRRTQNDYTTPQDLTITAADLPKVQTTSPTTAHFQRFSAKWSAVWALALVTRSLHTADRGNYIIRDPTRRRHASSQLLMLQNPHDRRRGERARTTPEPMCISCPDVDRLSGCR